MCPSAECREHELSAVQPHPQCWCLCDPFSSATRRYLAGQRLSTRLVPLPWGSGPPQQGSTFEPSFGLTCSRIRSLNIPIAKSPKPYKPKVTQPQPDPYLLVLEKDQWSHGSAGWDVPFALSTDPCIREVGYFRKSLQDHDSFVITCV